MQQLSKTKLKLFTSLQAKKFRYRHQMFLVEGKKMVSEALEADWEIIAVVLHEDIDQGNEPFLQQVSESLVFSANDKDFKSLASLKSPEGVICVLGFPFPEFGVPSNQSQLPGGKGLLLEQIQDPGNLGTIIRTADWFGIEHVFCSSGTVDFLNPKTLRSSMGSLFRVKIHYIQNWTTLLEQNANRIWVADMKGVSPEKAGFSADSWVLMGNEANGVSEEARNISGINRVSIPRKGGAESLNVAIAAGILMNYL